jgi:hypothetical protein
MPAVLHRANKVLTQNVDLADFPVEKWIHDPDLSAVEGIDPRYWVIVGDNVTSVSPEEISAGEAMRLPRARALRVNAVDDKTAELIANGFEFPPESGKVFSLSLESQANIHWIYTARNLPEITYPIHWLTSNDEDSVDLEDAADVENFFLTALTAIRAARDAGNALKDQVRAATTRAAVAAITDAR